MTKPRLCYQRRKGEAAMGRQLTALYRMAPHPQGTFRDLCCLRSRGALRQRGYGRKGLQHWGTHGVCFWLHLRPQQSGWGRADTVIYGPAATIGYCLPVPLPEASKSQRIQQTETGTEGGALLGTCQTQGIFYTPDHWILTITAS